ncbi:uncharacterized protein LOC134252926 [Saccostrea cucullata]|uniref:uncharacterized protein LOC134252926 n=1 Tax=Saccostrea cuccullata TaxID=36930 RepID=UPI002ED2D275
MCTLGFSTRCKIRHCFRCEGDTEFYCNTCKYDLCLQCKERHNTDSHKVLLYRSKHRKRGFTIQCKIRQCSQCQGDTEYYCNTCKHDLCLECKERHVTNFLTKHHKVPLYKALTKQCKIHQCSQCQGDTEYYCYTCKHDLCKQCKKKHVVDLNTIYHDVVIYRETYNIAKQETCVRHVDTTYEMFCYSCELPVCVKCTGHRQHLTKDIVKAYKTNRQQHRGTIHNIRSEILNNAYSLLAGMETRSRSDITFRTSISKCKSEMSTKAKRLKDYIDNVQCDNIKKITCYLKYRLQKHKRKMIKHLASIESYEHIFDQSANLPVHFLLFQKNTNALTTKITPNLTQNVLFSLAEETYIDVIQILNEIQIIETGRRRVRSENLMKMMSTFVLHKSISVRGVFQVKHISYVTSNRFWISDINNLILIDSAGRKLHQLTNRGRFFAGAHAVNMSCDLCFIDIDGTINKYSRDNKVISTLIQKTEPWTPFCVYCSLIDGDLLLGMENTDTKIGKVTRYNSTGQHVQTIQLDDRGEKLYSRPMYITENRNGDIIVSDYFCHAVVVTDRGGRHRFSYRGHPPRFLLQPRGICTDALLHILVCDFNTQTVQMIDKEGRFISLINIPQEVECKHWSLFYDEKRHLLWVGSFDNNTMCAYRYKGRQDNCLTDRS